MAQVNAVQQSNSTSSDWVVFTIQSTGFDHPAAFISHFGPVRGWMIEPNSTIVLSLKAIPTKFAIKEQANIMQGDGNRERGSNRPVGIGNNESRNRSLRENGETNRVCVCVCVCVAVFHVDIKRERGARDEYGPGAFLRFRNTNGARPSSAHKRAVSGRLRWPSDRPLSGLFADISPRRSNKRSKSRMNH